MGHTRQNYLETRPLAERALDRQLSTVLFHESVYRGQTEAGSLAGALGGEEGIENPGQRLAIHSVARIAHPHRNALAERALVVSVALGAPLQVQCLDRKEPALRHRVRGVERQVHDDALEL